jgi:DNA-binding transcriptional ArsR family regulator
VVVKWQEQRGRPGYERKTSSWWTARRVPAITGSVWSAWMNCNEPPDGPGPEASAKPRAIAITEALAALKTCATPRPRPHVAPTTRKRWSSPPDARFCDWSGARNCPQATSPNHFPLTRPAISKHLTVLKPAGLITDRRHGTQRLYLADSQAVRDLRAMLDTFWDQGLDQVKIAAGLPTNLDAGDVAYDPRQVELRADCARDPSCCTLRRGL